MKFLQVFSDLAHYLSERAALQEWLSFGLILLIGGFITWILNQRVVAFIRSRCEQKSPALSQKWVAVVSGPLQFVIFSYFFVWGFDQFKGMPPTLWQRVHTFYPIINIIAIFLFAFRGVDLLAEFLRQRWAVDNTALDESWAKLIGVIGRVVIALIGLLILLGKLGIDYLPLLTGAGFLGAAFALASQSTIANAIGSFEIMMDRLFKEGDHISFGDYNGFVTKMGLRSIELTALTGEKINLPNKDLVDKQIRNYTRKGRNCLLFTLGLTYGHDRARLERAMQLLREIIEAHPLTSAPNVYFRQFGSSTLDLQVVCWAEYKDNLGFTTILSELNLAIKERFDAEGFDFAFPTTTIHLASGLPLPEARN